MAGRPNGDGTCRARRHPRGGLVVGLHLHRESGFQINPNSKRPVGLEPWALRHPPLRWLALALSCAVGTVSPKCEPFFGMCFLKITAGPVEARNLASTRCSSKAEQQADRSYQPL